MYTHALELASSQKVLIEAKASYEYEFGTPTEGSVFIAVEINNAGSGTVIPSALDVELWGSGKLKAKGNTPLTLDKVVLSIQESVLASPHPWKVKVTNTTNITFYIIVHVQYRGRRRLLDKPYPIELLNYRLETLFNKLQPIKLKFKNALWGYSDIHGKKTPFPDNMAEKDKKVPAGCIKINRTAFYLTPEQHWSDNYPDMAMTKFIGHPFMNKPLESTNIHLEACVVEDRPAIKVHVSFSPCEVEVGGLIRAFLWDNEVVDALSKKLNFNETTIDIYFVLRTEPVTGGDYFPVPGFDVRVNARVGNRPDLFGGLLEFMIKQVVASDIEDTMHRYAKAFLGFLIGDPTLEVQGVKPELELQYKESKYVGEPTVAMASDPEPKLQPGNLSKIDHIVVLMMENRSFDHMLGYLSLPTVGNDGRVGAGRMDVDGLTGIENNPVDYEYKSRIRVHPLTSTDFNFDLGHSRYHQLVQRGAIYSKVDDQSKYHFSSLPADGYGYTRINDGFAINFKQLLDQHHPELSEEERAEYQKWCMGYQPRENVPVYDYLAHHFAICDKWFAPVPTNTWPNRFVSLTGFLNLKNDGEPGELELGVPDTSAFVPSKLATIFDHLTSANISWKYYEGNIATLRLFEKYTTDQEHIKSFNPALELGDAGFVQDLINHGRNNDLPGVIYIDPTMIDPSPIDANDDHPPADISNGQKLVNTILKSLMALPQWSKILFLITYDEHGGIYDHVHPPKGATNPLFTDPDTKEPVTYRGFRVPAFVISPWVPAGLVSHEVYDHTTVLKTIMARFLYNNPPNMGMRVRDANHVGSLLSLHLPRVTTLPVLNIKSVRKYTNTLQPADVYKGDDDFRALLSGVSRKHLASAG